MGQIRQLIYLDEYKLYSLSSQLFGGLTSSLLQYEESVGAEEEKQKGPQASGRRRGHLDTRVQGQQERRLLHDHTYALFEEELKNKNAITEYDHSSCSEKLEYVPPGSFIKVRANKIPMTGAGTTLATGWIPDLSGTYAIASKGVTTGDSHAHISGYGAAVTEVGLSIANNTTGNVSSTAHGFCPIGPNDTSKYLRGDSTPAWTEIDEDIRITIDGGGSAITTGAKKVYALVGFACTIIGWAIAADVSGAIATDIWICTQANHNPPTHPASGDRISSTNRAEHCGDRNTEFE